MITREIRVWLVARGRISGYGAYVQAAADWHAFDFQAARERQFVPQSIEERAGEPVYQAYLKVKDVFDAAAKLLPEYAEVEAEKRRRRLAVQMKGTKQAQSFGIRPLP